MLFSIPLLIFYFDEADYRYETGAKKVGEVLCCDEEFLTCYESWAVVFRGAVSRLLVEAPSYG